MTTYATGSADLDLRLEPTFAYDDHLAAPVANPRRTTWTGYAKTDVDRLPAT